jgi:tripartite-type tricarboxylate transporter receptor subunit TctC
MVMRMKLIVVLMILVSFWSFSAVQAAETRFPTKTIEIDVGYPPGGGTDLGARLIAEKAKALLGQEIVVVNKPGGGGVTAATIISQAKPDGYLLGAVTDSAYTFYPLFDKYSYDPVNDFTMIAQYGTLQCGLLVREDSPFKTFKDVVDYARANPEKFTIGTIGIVSEPTFSVEVAAKQENIKIKMIPMAGAPDAMAAVMGGHVMAGDVCASGWAQCYRSKKIRMLALFNETRSDSFPEIPTLKEMGYPFGFTSNYVIVGPRGMEKPVRDKLADAFSKATLTPEWTTLMKNLEAWTKGPLPYGEKLQEITREKQRRFADQVRKMGVGLKDQIERFK